jgi:hypothetical protein
LIVTLLVSVQPSGVLFLDSFGGGGGGLVTIFLTDDCLFDVLRPADFDLDCGLKVTKKKKTFK